MPFILEDEISDIKQRTTLLYENSTTGFIVTLAAFSLLNFGLVHNNNSVYIGAMQSILWVCMAFVCLGRFVDVKLSLRKMDSAHFDYKSALQRFSVGLYANCLLWAIFTLTFLPEMSLIELTLTAIVISGLAGGSITVLGPVRSMTSIYVSCLLLPFSIMGFTLDIPGFAFVSFLALAFWAVMLVTAKKSSDFVSTTINLQTDKTSLLEALQTEKIALEKSNIDLISANIKLDENAVNLQDEVNIRTQEIFRISNLDPLTQLLNRSAFLKSLEQLFIKSRVENKQYTLYFIDLNGFKGINDSFGHAHGDRVLSEIANRLSQLCSTSFGETAIVSRWGGDEFILVCEYTSEQQATIAANQITHAIQQPIHVDVDCLRVFASLGVTIYPQHSTEPLELIQFADLAMYHCKNSQATTALFYTPHLLDQFLRQQRIRKGLSKAIENNELFLVYQPIVDIQENRVFAFETLLRWKFKGELIGPDEFIPIAEKSGLIVSIGQWVVENAIKAFCQLENYHHYKLSINISRVQIVDASFARNMLNIINQYPIDKANIHFEITETSEVEDQNTFNQVIKHLVDCGLGISVDDFGVGYSSLQQLQALNFDVVKIDRSFIKDLNKKDIAIVSAAHFIAQQFDAITIVEGVENEQQLQLLKSLGFRYIQGYYYAKPMQFDALVSWLLSANQLILSINSNIKTLEIVPNPY